MVEVGNAVQNERSLCPVNQAAAGRRASLYYICEFHCTVKQCHNFDGKWSFLDFLFLPLLLFIIINFFANFGNLQSPRSSVHTYVTLFFICLLQDKRDSTKDTTTTSISTLCIRFILRLLKNTRSTHEKFIFKTSKLFILKHRSPLA